MKKPTIQKVLLLGFAICLIAAFFRFDLHRHFTLASLKSHQAQLQFYYAQHATATIAVYVIAYIVMAALSLPGATVMTLAGGALFGLPLGTLLVSVSSTVGATLAFLAARYLLNNLIRTKFSARWDIVNRGIERDGARYLLTLRLIPAIPFVVINLVMGLTSIRVGTFYLVSQIGMLPATLVYVNAGTQISRIDSISAILSWPLIASLILLATFPWLTKKLLARI